MLNYCPYCGMALDKKEYIICPTCKKSLKENNEKYIIESDFVICPMCGALHNRGREGSKSYSSHICSECNGTGYIKHTP